MIPAAFALLRCDTYEAYTISGCNRASKALDSPMAAALHEQLDTLWQAAGWADGSPSIGQGTWAVYADERNYPI